MFVIRNRQEFRDGKTCDAVWGLQYKSKVEGWTCLGDAFQFKKQSEAASYAQKNNINLGFFETDNYTNLVSVVETDKVVILTETPSNAPMITDVVIKSDMSSN